MIKKKEMISTADGTKFCCWKGGKKQKFKK